MPYQKYPHFGRIGLLPNTGRELLGKDIWITEKRDGQNVPIYMNKNSDIVLIGSRNRAIADSNIISGVKDCDDWPKLVELIQEYPHWVIYIEHFKPGKSPTRIERPKKKNSFVVIDIWDSVATKWMTYNFVHQMCFHRKLGIVKLYDVIRPTSLEELWEKREYWVEYAKKHCREGIVGKTYENSPLIIFKEKVDLPKLQKEERLKQYDSPDLPHMPHDVLMRAVDQGMNEVVKNGGDPKDKSVAMPVVAKYVGAQAREHDYNPKVSNLFECYVQWLKENT